MTKDSDYRQGMDGFTFDREEGYTGRTEGEKWLMIVALLASCHGEICPSLFRAGTELDKTSRVHLYMLVVAVLPRTECLRLGLVTAPRLAP
jgi:hypothetical protein